MQKTVHVPVAVCMQSSVKGKGKGWGYEFCIGNEWVS